MVNLKDFVIDVPGFPSPGIIFRDITPVLANHRALAFSIEELARPFEGMGIDAVVGIESRGFIFGAPLALKLGASFVPIRKKGKLPREVLSEPLVKEYGEDVIEIHRDDLSPGAKVLIVDDVLATGGTLESAAKIIGRTGAHLVGIVVLINLSYLHGKERLLRELSPDTIFHYLLEY